MLILASKSAIRKTLLDNAGLYFSVATAPVDERAIESRVLTENPNRAALALVLAQAKALAVSSGHADAVVVGADQTLEFEGAILHKPASRAEAADRLMAMAGKTHALHSGAALAQGGKILWSTVETAFLTLKPVSRAQVEAVLDLEGDAILSSVGGYRLEGPSVRLFEKIEGDYFTILGLPLLALLAALEIHAPQTLANRIP